MRYRFDQFEVDADRYELRRDGAAQAVEPLVYQRPAADIDLKRMAAWAMNYLIRTPRPRLNYQPIFQGNMLACPPAPEGGRS